MQTLRRASLGDYFGEQFGWQANSAVSIDDYLHLNMRLPFGRTSEQNELNNLTGREWIKFSKSWFVLNPPGRKKATLDHPAKFPEQLVKDFIRFFTKKGEIVVDPFLGTGTTMIVALETGRPCIGVELSPKWVEIAQKRFYDSKKMKVSILDRFLAPLWQEGSESYQQNLANNYHIIQG